MKYSNENGVHAGVAYSFDGLLPSEHLAVGENKFGEIFVLIQSKGVGRNICAIRYFFRGLELCGYYLREATKQERHLFTLASSPAILYMLAAACASIQVINDGWR